MRLVGSLESASVALRSRPHIWARVGGGSATSGGGTEAWSGGPDPYRRCGAIRQDLQVGRTSSRWIMVGRARMVVGVPGRGRVHHPRLKIVVNPAVAPAAYCLRLVGAPLPPPCAEAVPPRGGDSAV